MPAAGTIVQDLVYVPPTPYADGKPGERVQVSLTGYTWFTGTIVSNDLATQRTYTVRVDPTEGRPAELWVVTPLRLRAPRAASVPVMTETTATAEDESAVAVATPASPAPAPVSPATGVSDPGPAASPPPVPQDSRPEAVRPGTPDGATGSAPESASAAETRPEAPPEPPSPAAPARPVDPDAKPTVELRPDPRLTLELTPPSNPLQLGVDPALRLSDPGTLVPSSEPPPASPGPESAGPGEGGTVAPDRPLVSCPPEQRRYPRDSRPDQPLIERLITCQWERPPAPGGDGAVTFDIDRLDFRRTRLMSPEEIRDGMHPATIVHEFYVTYTRKRHLRDAIEVESGEDLYMAFVDRGGKWRVQQRESLGRPRSERIPR